MKLSIPLILTLALIAAGAGLFLYGQNKENAALELNAMDGFVPPLQKGHIDLKGNYVVTSIQQVNATNINVYVDYNGPETSYAMEKNKLYTQLLVQITVNDSNELGIKIIDKENTRFEVPYNNLYPHNKVFNFPAENNFDIQVNQPNFSLTIKRKDTGEVVFDTKDFFFVFSDLYHEISINMKGEYIYGLGERRRKSFLYDNGLYTFLNKDQYMSVADGQPDQQTYGTHPMYLRREESGNYHVVFLRNYNSIQAQYTRGDHLTFIVVGGLLEFKIFLGDKYPETSLKAYHSYINGFSLHPFWAHGYHQCRWGYDNSTKMVQVWNKFNELDLPIDTIWSDIDYMKELTDFTIDTERYDAKEMNVMLDRKQPLGIHWVPIIDAGIAIRDVSNERGKEMKIYQKSNKTGEDLIGCVWPGQVNYPDFNHPLSYDFWSEGLQNITKNYGITPSGFWIDMNEFSNFIHGEIAANEKCIMPNDPDAPVDEKYLGITVEDFYSKIPFEVGGADHPLQEKTMSYDAPKYNKEDAKTVYYAQGTLREFDFHNLNGFSEGIATNEALKQMGNKLPFIISRSQIAGSGQFVQHWTGDNGANWEFLQYSLAEIFNFNLYAIPMTGADICGFAMNTTAELCARWMQVGSFYPFSRNHNANDTIAQEPYAFTEPYVLSSSRKSLKLRYGLLKQYYAYFVASHGVGTIFRPSFFNFPEDENLFANDQQFMIYDALLGLPVLQQANDADKAKLQTTIKTYFPKGGAFYDFRVGNSRRYTNADSNKDKVVAFDDTMPLYIREGAVVFTQFDNDAKRARDLGNRFEVHLALKKNADKTYSAKGKFIAINEYTDDNLINKCLGENNCAIDVEFAGVVIGEELKLTITITGETKQTNFDEFFIYQYQIYSEDLYINRNPIYLITLPVRGNLSATAYFPLGKAN